MLISVPTTQLEAPGVRIRLERISGAFVTCDCEDGPVEYAYTLVVYAPVIVGPVTSWLCAECATWTVTEFRREHGDDVHVVIDALGAMYW